MTAYTTWCLLLKHAVRGIRYVSVVQAALWVSASAAQDGGPVYEKACAVCHAQGVSGAPRIDDTTTWQFRLSRNGYSGLFDSAISGRGAMPPKGGNTGLSDAEVMSAVMHMLRRAAVDPTFVASSPTRAINKAAPTPAAKTAGSILASTEAGRTIYGATCAVCHATGVAGAPKVGDAKAWAARISAGTIALYDSALKGKGAMPAKGGNAGLTEVNVKAAVDFMVAQSRGGTVARPATASAMTPTFAATVSANVPTVAESGGRSIYQSTCAACHGSGIAGAPKVGDAAAWASRARSGTAALYMNAISGKGAMPAKGGNTGLSEDDVRGAVDFMLAAVNIPTEARKIAPTKSADEKLVATLPTSTSTPPPSANPLPAMLVTTTNIGGVNTFNRLLLAPGNRHLPPLEDGIHDPVNDATALLQAPLQAYTGLPRNSGSGHIDWVKALGEKKVQPRADKDDAKAEMAVLDLNIVREVRGSMPDVVFPHRAHTQWLDCANCHPAIFIPQKGANQMSMASIMLGQKCGVCHGKVAFPISECRMCHSKSRESSAVAVGGKP